MKSTSSKYGYGSDNKYARQHKPTHVNVAPPTPVAPVAREDSQWAKEQHTKMAEQREREGTIFRIAD